MVMYNRPDQNVSDRIREFLRESDQLGIDPIHAITVATVSINESGATFGIRRQGNVLPPDCYPARQIMILEVGNPFLNGLQVSYLPDSWTDDDEIMTLLRDMEWIQDGPLVDGRVRGIQASESLAAFDSLGSPNVNMVAFFDFLLDRRKTEALRSFSIGPTQTFLRYAAFTQQNGGPWFNSFDHLWRFWTSTSTEERWASGAWDYLDTSFKLTETLAVCGSADNGCIELWLQNFQTGAKDWSSERHSAYARNFAANRDIAYRIAREEDIID